MIQETSLIAYAGVLENLGERQREVYKALLNIGPTSNTMLSKHLRLPINCVVPRINELRKKHVVKQARKDICPVTGMPVIFWRVSRKLY